MNITSYILNKTNEYNFRATYLAANLVFHDQVKYVKIHYHFVREKVAMKWLEN